MDIARLPESSAAIQAKIDALRKDYEDALPREVRDELQALLIERENAERREFDAFIRKHAPLSPVGRAK